MLTGGEGLYAFAAKKVSKLFDMVARNIREGGVESEGGALSPPDGGRAPSHSPISLVPSPSPNPPPPPPPASNPHSHPPAHLPNYQNLNYQNGQGGGGRLSSSPPPALPRDRRTSNSSTTPSLPERPESRQANYINVTPQRNITTRPPYGKHLSPCNLPWEGPNGYLCRFGPPNVYPKTKTSPK